MKDKTYIIFRVVAFIIALIGTSMIIPNIFGDTKIAAFFVYTGVAFVATGHLTNLILLIIKFRE